MSPTNRTFPLASGGRPKPGFTTISPGATGTSRSADVNTPTTPGIAAPPAVSTETIRAWATVERTKARCRTPGTARSSTYAARPSRMSGSSTRGTALPSSDPAGVMAADLTGRSSLPGDRAVAFDEQPGDRVDEAVALLRLDVVERPAVPVALESAAGQAEHAVGEREHVGVLPEPGGGGERERETPLALPAEAGAGILGAVPALDAERARPGRDDAPDGPVARHRPRLAAGRERARRRHDRQPRRHRDGRRERAVRLRPGRPGRSGR